MERSYQSFRAPQDVVIQFGASDSVGNEKPGSHHFLNLNRVQPTSGPYGTPVGDPMDISIALTPRQVAQIVKHFFVEVVFAGGICQKFFERLMTKRWAVMTADEYKTADWDVSGFREMHYHREIPQSQSPLKRPTCEEFRQMVLARTEPSDDDQVRAAEHINHCGSCCYWVDNDLGGGPEWVGDSQRGRVLTLLDGKEPDNRFE